MMPTKQGAVQVVTDTDRLTIVNQIATQLMNSVKGATRQQADNIANTVESQAFGQFNTNKAAYQDYILRRVYQMIKSHNDKLAAAAAAAAAGGNAGALASVGAPAQGGVAPVVPSAAPGGAAAAAARIADPDLARRFSAFVAEVTRCRPLVLEAHPHISRRNIEEGVKYIKLYENLVRYANGPSMAMNANVLATLEKQTAATIDYMTKFLASQNIHVAQPGVAAGAQRMPPAAGVASTQARLPRPAQPVPSAATRQQARPMAAASAPISAQQQAAASRQAMQQQQQQQETVGVTARPGQDTRTWKDTLASLERHKDPTMTALLLDGSLTPLLQQRQLYDAMGGVGESAAKRKRNAADDLFVFERDRDKFAQYMRGGRAEATALPSDGGDDDAQRGPGAAARELEALGDVQVSRVGVSQLACCFDTSICRVSLAVEKLARYPEVPPTVRVVAPAFSMDPALGELSAKVEAAINGGRNSRSLAAIVNAVMAAMNDE